MDTGAVNLSHSAQLWLRGIAGPEEGLNEAFIREVLAWIELHQELWNQNTWHSPEPCGTAYCFAGWAVKLGTDLEVESLGTLALVRKAMELTGLSTAQASELFWYVAEPVEDPIFESGYVGHQSYRKPTFEEFCAKVEAVTGIRFKPRSEAIDG